jgi:hypothetical protein
VWFLVDSLKKNTLGSKLKGAESKLAVGRIRSCGKDRKANKSSC